MGDKRTAQIETSCAIKINTGNFETFDVSKRLVVEIEYESPKELAEKSEKVDALVIKMTQHEADLGLERMGRKRYAKVNGKDIVCGTWADLETVTL